MMPGMNDDASRPDSGQLDMSSHDQTPDMSLDTSMSIREAATAADVTEKTIRRWIKSGRLHAVKLGGQYRITVADLDHAKEGNVQASDTGSPTSGHDSPRIDMSEGPDGGHGHVQGEQRVQEVDLTPLVNHIAVLEQRIGQLTEASTIWQVRALQAEEQLKQLTAGRDAVANAPGSPESATDDAHESTDESGTETPPQGLWARLRRRLLGK
jgi:excisionase family DNA binding protein